MVYVTETGKKYHKKGCEYLKSIKGCFRFNEISNYNYTACMLCFRKKWILYENFQQN